MTEIKRWDPVTAPTPVTTRELLQWQINEADGAARVTQSYIHRQEFELNESREQLRKAISRRNKWVDLLELHERQEANE